MPTRSDAAAARWQDRVDGLVLLAAVLGIAGVALQTLAKHGPLHVLGLAAVTASWGVFAVEAAVLLAVHPRPGAWARGHAYDLGLVVATAPVWPLLLRDLLLLELLPALTVLEAAKLAKLAKLGRALRRRQGGRAAAAVLLVAAAAVAVLVLSR